MESIMRYIRTTDGRVSYLSSTPDEGSCGYEIITSKGTRTYRVESEVIKIANTIEELCDKFVIKHKKEEPVLLSYRDFKRHFDLYNQEYSKVERYGAIWTDKGLIYVAKMNEKGELELL